MWGPILLRARPGRIDRRLLVLAGVFAAGCLNLAVQRERTRLVWSKPPEIVSVAGATGSSPASSAGQPTERRRDPVPDPPDREPGVIDLNRAGEQDLETLPGIGPTLARRIVGDRLKNGPFASVADLERVSGIGPAKVARLTGLLRVGEDSGDRR